MNLLWKACTCGILLIKICCLHFLLTATVNTKGATLSYILLTILYTRTLSHTSIRFHWPRSLYVDVPCFERNHRQRSRARTRCGKTRAFKSYDLKLRRDFVAHGCLRKGRTRPLILPKQFVPRIELRCRCTKDIRARHSRKLI